MATSLSAAQQASIESLANRLNDPQVAGALHNLLDHADLLAVLLVGLDGFVSRSEVIGEALAGSLVELRGVAEANKPATAINPAELVSSLVTLSAALPKLTPGLTRVADEDLVGALLDSGIASQASLSQISMLVRALTAGVENAAANPIRVSGPLALLRQLKDPDIARGLGFTLSVLKAVGAELGADQAGK